MLQMRAIPIHWLLRYQSGSADSQASLSSHPLIVRFFVILINSHFSITINFFWLLYQSYSCMHTFTLTHQLLQSIRMKWVSGLYILTNQTLLCSSGRDDPNMTKTDKMPGMRMWI